MKEKKMKEKAMEIGIRRRFVRSKGAE